MSFLSAADDEGRSMGDNSANKHRAGEALLLHEMGAFARRQR